MVMGWPQAIAQGWHPVAALSEVRGRPLARRLLGQRLVVFKGAEGVAVLRDRCPHRGMPLSAGRVVEGTIACPYHGWRFAGNGACVQVPGASRCPDVQVASLPVRVAAGLVWTSLGDMPADFPKLPDAMEDAALDRFWWMLKPSPARVLDALENHLDPAHPHFVHRWLVRHPHRRAATRVEVRSGPWGAEAVYFEQRRNRALLSAAMEGHRMRSSGRLWPPSIGEVRLESARGAMLSVAVVFAPVDSEVTRPYAHFASTRGLLPAWPKRIALMALHVPVLAQDRRILRLQTTAGSDEGYCVGPLDMLALAIWRHANGEICPEEERTLDVLL
jgi:phenylpropionate dioxygenase-like ring-hydroxylating dioxygenase large terminal subunit